MRINWGKRKGFTLIELLIVVAIIGIIAAIAIPNLLSAIQRSKQKRTMSDMRSIGTGLGSYQVDFNGYPTGTIQTAWNLLDPNYIVNPPTKDGWRTTMNYKAAGGAGTWAQNYTLTSYGKNLISDGWLRELTRYFNCDIIYNDGQFVQSPEGIQKS
ncbi:MAG: prepilin-type N-terminal cleavage/methylation domain-containing protein [Acidobacteriota bacterium]